jgi:hypothetical protein
MKKVLAKGLCNTHYSRLKRTGETSDPDKKKERHGCSHTREYYVWRNIVARCCDPNNSTYKYYGGRGISICDEWRHSYTTFVRDMGNPPKGLVIDRIDVNGNYCKGNCRWVTVAQNNRNQRRNILTDKLVREMRSLNLMPNEAAKKYGVSLFTASSVLLHRQWKDENGVDVEQIETEINKQMATQDEPGVWMHLDTILAMLAICKEHRASLKAKQEVVE